MGDLSVHSMTNSTDKFRILGWGLFTGTVITAVVGWVVFRLDPGELAPVLTAVTAAAGIGEMSNVGKRATSDPDVMRAEHEIAESQNPYIEMGE